MRFIRLVMLCLFIPQVASAACCCFPRQLSGWWGSAEYLLMWRKKRFYPPLVTTAPVGTPASTAGVLGESTTTILFGDDSVGESPKSGGRGDFGLWLTPCWGFGGGGFGVGNEEVDFDINSDSTGVPIIARPFFAVDMGGQDAALLAFPSVPLGDQATGFVDIDTKNRVYGADFYCRYRWFCSPCFKIDFLGGFMYTRIDDDLEISDFSNNLEASDPMDILFASSVDRFDTKNNYYAGLIGFLSEWRGDRLALQVMGKFGLGGMKRQVDINGDFIITLFDGTVINFDRGLLALPTNSGNHSSTTFEVVSQLKANVQLCVWGGLWLTAGYEFIYWPKIALAGDQIDLNINTSQLPLSGPFVGPPDPQFNLNDTNFWLQGLTAGLYFLF